MDAMRFVYVLAVDSIGSRSGFLRSGNARRDTIVATFGCDYYKRTKVKARCAVMVRGSVERENDVVCAPTLATKNVLGAMSMSQHCSANAHADPWPVRGSGSRCGGSARSTEGVRDGLRQGRGVREERAPGVGSRCHPWRPAVPATCDQPSPDSSQSLRDSSSSEHAAQLHLPIGWRSILYGNIGPKKRRLFDGAYRYIV
jgi:hypothetical protein